MAGVALLARARAAGLTVQRAGDTLIIRGPRRAAALAELLLAHKAVVLAALAAEAHLRTETGLDADPDGMDVATAMWHVPCVDCGVELPHGYWYRCPNCVTRARKGFSRPRGAHH